MAATVADHVLARLVVCVLNNRELALVTWEQRAAGGDPRFETSQSLPNVPYADVARLVGLAGLRVDDPSALGDAWDAALSSDRPFVLEVVTDPEVPPLPPRVTADQARAIGSAFLRGDRDERRVLAATVLDRARELVRRRREPTTPSAGSDPSR